MSEESIAMFSLAELSDMDVSDIEEVRSSILPAGVYEFEVAKTTFEEETYTDRETEDTLTRFKASFELKVVEAKSLVDRKIDKESLVGAKFTEVQRVNPNVSEDEMSKVKASIGRIRALISDMGGDSAGKLGDVIENATGLVFTAKINHQKGQNGGVFARLELAKRKN